MEQISPIRVSLDSNEVHRARAKKIKAAILKDNHFVLNAPQKCPFDLCFQWEEKTINVELKDFTGTGEPQSDYVASIVNQSGHLYQQILAGRELQDPLIIVVLGDDAEIIQAITNTVLNRGIRGQEAEDRITEYISMVEDFEANCIGMNIQIWRLKIDPWRRMLQSIQKILQGGDLTVFRPKPAINERQAIGLSILCGKGLGPARASRILEEFDVSLVPKKPDTYLDDCQGIGPKLATLVQDALFVSPACVNRPRSKRSPKLQAGNSDHQSPLS
ncbi:MAG: hypothetical protein PHN61_14285 [Methanothrix sp.]|nr:hypothetical protein [Methanothrix sp.]